MLLRQKSLRIAGRLADDANFDDRWLDHGKLRNYCVLITHSLRNSCWLIMSNDDSCTATMLPQSLNTTLRRDEKKLKKFDYRLLMSTRRKGRTSNFITILIAVPNARWHFL